MIGSRLGSYEILEEIGSGGMGRVYKARQEGLDRMVAVKALLPQFANDPIFVERFLREARAIAALEHPGIVTIYDVGESEKTYFFAMQFLAGRTLEEILAEHVPVPASEAASITKKVAGALGYAHDAGILHRDVKTGNIFITDDGRVVLTDFGIAWAASQTRLTMANTSLGSPGYMAPEQVEGKTLDRRADLYSLGVVLFEMLTGETPFKGDSAVSIAYQHVQAPVPSVSDFDSTVPPDLEAVTRRLMSKSPDDRHGDAEALIEDLERIERGEPIQGQSGGPSPSKRRWLGIAVATTIAALGVAGALLLIRNKEESGPEAANGTVQGAPIETAAAAESGEASLVDAPTPDDEPRLAESQPTESADPTEIAPAAHDVAAGEPPGEPAGTARTFLVTSQPEGARVRLNGQELVQETPVSVDLEPGVAHEVSLSLDGHEPAGWSFSLDDLNDAQDSSGELHFPLKSSIPPAALSLSAPFQFQLQIDGKTYESPISELALEPGSYQIRIEAPTVFYAETRRINLESGVSSTLDLPALAPLTVAATPSLCRIRIDGRDAGYVPIQLDIAVGTHEFQFDWENLGKTLTLTRAVTNETGRVFAAAPTP